MSPSPAALAKNDARVGVSQPDLTTMAEDEDELPVDRLSGRACLGVPGFKECMTSRGMRRVSNDTWDAHEVKVLGGRGAGNTVLHIAPTSLFSGRSGLGEVRGSETRDVDNLEVGSRHRK